MNNILYLILHSPSNTVLAKGTIIKQDNKKIFIDYNGKRYVYIKDGKDASVSYNSADFKFINRLDYDIKIEAFVEDNKVKIKLLRI